MTGTYLAPPLLEPLVPELPLLPGAAGVLGVAPPMLPAPPVLPLPELELSDEPELPPLEDGAAPEGEGEELEGEELEGEDGVADDAAAPPGEAPEEDDEDEVSPLPAEGVLGVLGVVALLLELGAAGVVAAEPLDEEPGAAPEVPEPPPSLLQPASSAARILAANRTFEGCVSFIVGFL